MYYDWGTGHKTRKIENYVVRSLGKNKRITIYQKSELSKACALNV
jgi:hypothetical protein